MGQETIEDNAVVEHVFIFTEKIEKNLVIQLFSPKIMLKVYLLSSCETRERLLDTGVSVCLSVTDP